LEVLRVAAIALSEPSWERKNTMRTLITLISSGSILAFSILVASAKDVEEDIALDKVPKAVLDAVKARFKGANLVGAAQETSKEKGDRLVYEVSLKHKGRRIDALFTPGGEMFLYEAQITAKELPAAVAKTLNEKYPEATYKLYEQLYKVENKEEKLQCYEVQLQTADTKKAMEVQVSEAGKIIKAVKASGEGMQ
jgi:putative PepSY-like beta-lactamase-inhibitor